MEFHALTIQTCEEVHQALGLAPQDWVQAFIHARVPVDLAWEFFEIFEDEREEGSKAETEDESRSLLEATHMDESNFSDLTLHD